MIFSDVATEGYLLQVIAIMVKRRSVEDGGEDRGVVISEVQQLIRSSGHQQMQLIGCSIITALMQEYATTVKSSDVGLPWEVHFKAKKQFESTDLQNIFRFSVGALRELAANLVLPLGEEMRNLVRRLTVISETVLSWTFINVNLPKKLISVFESDQNPSLRPGAAWKEVMLDPSLVSFFFDLHILACVFPVGLWYCIKNVNDERVFIILYAISAVYFAGVMVRLMLTLTPCVCILAAIAFSKLFSIYLKEDEAAKEAEDPETSEKNGRLYDKVLEIVSKEKKINFSIKGWKNQKDEA